MKKIIVTGGAGFIGRHLVKALLGEGYDVHIIDILIDEFTDEKVAHTVLLKYFDEDFINSNIHVYDVLNYEAIEPLFKDAYAVIHLAAFISSPNSINKPRKAFKVNIEGTLNVLEASRVNNCKNIILTSSAAVYGSKEGIAKETDTVQPENPYGLSKHIKEHLGKLYTHLYGMNVTCVRYSNVWGPDQHDSGSYAPAIGRFINQAKNSQPITICGDGEQTRDFIHIEDAVEANLRLLENIHKDDIRGEVFNVCSGVESKIIHIANLIKKIYEEKNEAGEIAVIHIEPRKEPRKFSGDNAKIRKAIDWEPKVTLEEGIKNLL